MKKSSDRGDRFDRGDFESRDTLVNPNDDFKLSPGSTDETAAPPENGTEVAAADEQTASDHLRQIGYTDAEIDRLMAGPREETRRG